MKTAGIIAEYNPFHCGHRYHIEETRRQTGADTIIAVMSPDFVQRGAPAILDKYTRARMALENGADLVIELSAVCALSSAEGFAAGSVNLLENLGVVDAVSFGTESSPEEAPLILAAADLLRSEPAEFSAVLTGCLKDGMNYPTAQETAFAACLRANPQNPAFAKANAETIVRLFENPNNILALEYTKALLAAGSSMEICMIQRQGSGHNDSTLAGAFSCASAIRTELLRCRSQTVGATGAENSLQGGTFPAGTTFAAEHSAGKHYRETAALTDSLCAGNLPASVLTAIEQAGPCALLREDDFSDLLFFSIEEKQTSLQQYGTANADLAARCGRLLEQFENWSQFAALLKTKNQTYSAISRYLAHLLLGITAKDRETAAAFGFAPYARVLGFRTGATPLIKQMKERSRVPLLLRPARDMQLLSEEQKHLFGLDLHAAAVYSRILYTRTGKLRLHELRQPLIILP